MSPSRGGSPVTTRHTNWITREWSWLKDNSLAKERGDEQLEEESNSNQYEEAMSIEKATTIASCFLMDYEYGRPPTFSSQFEKVSDQQLRLYKVKFSSWWKWFGLCPATVIMFTSYFGSPVWTAILHLHAVVIFMIDLYLTLKLFDAEWFDSHERRIERHIQRAVFVFIVIFGIQSWFWFFLEHPQDNLSSLVVSLFKPLLLFYLSRRARDALEALVKIAKILARVVVIELFLILAFAAVACRLYYEDGNFHNLASSWLSLFQLSTGVVNPSLWLPMYEENRANAIFFVIFIVTCTFYLHSLILALVFQVFVQAATEVHHRSAVDKENSIRYAFLVLSSKHVAKQSMGQVHTDMIRETMQKVKSNYGPLKMDILMELVDPMKTCSLDYTDFRTSIKDALSLTIRSARNTSLFARAVETLSILVTGINCLFVILLTSHYQAGLQHWFLAIGSLITFFCMVELGMRCNVCTMSYYPMTRQNAVFDGFAAIGAVISCYGICTYLAGHTSGMDYLFTGRAIDIVRTMRFFSMFRDVVERSVNVLPALTGPVCLVLTTIHIFVYLGMVLWGGQIDADKLADNEDLQTLFYLNSFNSYPEGLVTIFNILVLNDWHQIAAVFMYADRFNKAYIVYPFFITVVLVAVCIMLNVFTAFFVETFVKRLSKNDIENDDVIALQKARGEYSATSPRGRSLPLLGSQFAWQSTAGKESIRLSASSASSESGEVVQFDVFERQGFDRIMEKVANESCNQDDVARCLCDTLEMVATLSSEWHGVEFLVCCQPSMNLFQTRNFRDSVAGILDGAALHWAIADLTSKLGSSTPDANDGTQGVDLQPLLQQFHHPSDPSAVLDLSVMLLPHVPNLYLFIGRRRSVPLAAARWSNMVR